MDGQEIESDHINSISKMDKYDRDAWHDAETIPSWMFYSIVIVLVILAIL